MLMPKIFRLVASAGSFGPASSVTALSPGAPAALACRLLVQPASIKNSVTRSL
jgi:hypothetical protein